MQRMVQLALAAISALAFTGAATAQSAASAGDGVQETLKAMQSEIEHLRNENQQMRGEIDDLHAQNDENWLTESRAEQIRGLVQDVIADADTRASLLQNGMTAGWSEHFFL